MTLGGDLKELGCDVDESDAGRAAYRHDASIFEATPAVVAFPRDAAEVGTVIRYAAAHPGVSITPRSAGTDMTGGAVGESILLDFTRHMHALADIVRDGDVPGQDGAARVQPGMYYRDFEQATLARGLQYPVYPASRDLCAVGGMVANNAAGERSLRYGQTVDFVRSVKAVLDDGNEYQFGPLDHDGLAHKLSLAGREGDIYRGMERLLREHAAGIAAARPKVSKNSSGYYLWRVREGNTFNLAKLLCGSQGTLAILTEATLGLVRPQQHRRMAVAFLDDVRGVADVVQDLMPLHPEALESFDDKTLSFTLRFLPDFVRVLGASNIVSLGLRFLPEAWMVLRGGLPKLVIIAEFAGDDQAEVVTRTQEAVRLLRARGLKARMTRDEEESHKYWTIRRQSFNVIRSHAKGKRTTPFIDDFIVPPERMPEFLPALYGVLEPYRLVLTVAGHVGNGNFHIIPLMDLADPRTRQVIPELAEKVYALVLAHGGSITAEHNDGLIRGPYVERQFGKDVYALFRETKRIWDPKGIFNPGKKVDVDWEWAMSHLRTD